MAKFKVSETLRIALWRANGEKCFYCKGPVALVDLDIDHIIPASLSQDRLLEIVNTMGLGSDFSVNSNQNLVPTHHSCNRQKSSNVFPEPGLRFWLESWRWKRSNIDREFDSLYNLKTSNRLLANLTSALESGRVLREDVLKILRNVALAEPDQSSQPWIVSLSVNLFEIEDEDAPSAMTASDLVAWYDKLELDLLSQIRSQISTNCVQTESERNGETISVRFAFLARDLDRFSTADLEPWEILEVERFGDIYGPESYRVLDQLAV